MNEDASPWIVAFVPMRHESERVPGKNYRPLGGVPLYHHIVRTLQACPLVSEVVIDTDSSLIEHDARRAFREIRVIRRPDHLLGGEVPMNDVLLHDVECVSADFYLQTHSTNPLLRADTVTRGLRALVSAGAAHDSMFSVTRLQTRLWSAAGEALNHDPRQLLRTQDLPPIYEENSCLYVFTEDGLRRLGSRIGERPLLYEVPAEEAWDIDEEIDFRVAECLYAGRGDRHA
jgi:CMP-N-acetylneuraminic acid synthetase